MLDGIDHFGVWTTTDLDGWWDSPEPKSNPVARENADGDFDVDTFYEARYVTVTGSFRAASHEMLHHGMNAFTGLVRGRSRFQVLEHGAAQWADVVRASRLQIVPVTDRYATWQVRLKAADPRKYGDVRRFTAASGSTVRVFHRGNADGWPSFSVSGSMPEGYSLWVGGRRFQVVRGLTSGSHTIDFRDGRLRVNGGFVAGGVGVADLAPVRPGAGVDVLLSPVSGSGSAAVTVFDTFI